jgi:serine protease DegQ
MGLTARHDQQNLSGVLLDELDQRSRLAREGLAEGDIITGVNRQRVHSLDDFRNAFEHKRSSILLQISRRGRAYIVRID